MHLEILEALNEDLDQIFQQFYDQLLSNADFDTYFKSPQQIEKLIKKQKAYFISSLRFSDDELKTRYIALGEMHYDLRLPFVDFSFALDILQEGTIHSIYKISHSQQTLRSAFTFFRLIRAYTAKGYLNRILTQDLKDIDQYLEKISATRESHNAISAGRFMWLKSFIFAIQKENRSLAPSFLIESDILVNIESSLKENGAFMEYIHDMVARIRIDASNVFYFLEKKDYSDVLPLYRELMSIYKLSLMLTNVITISNTDVLLGNIDKDPLTKLLTRSSMKRLIEKEFAMADSQNYAISLMMIDLDHFKSINDTYGHLTGDKALIDVANIILRSIRATDFAFRIGGEEILLLLKAAPRTVADKQAEAIRQDIEKHTLEHKGERVKVTASIGVSTFTGPFNITVNEAIAQVDGLMYKAKKLGRNTVVSG